MTNYNRSGQTKTIKNNSVQSLCWIVHFKTMIMMRLPLLSIADSLAWKVIYECVCVHIYVKKIGKTYRKCVLICRNEAEASAKDSKVREPYTTGTNRSREENNRNVKA